MTRPVLLGARQPLLAGSRFVWAYQVWAPVAIVLLAICRESTNSFSADATAGWIRHSAEFLFGPIANADWALINHHCRKTGHFLWYGITALSWLRAWLLTWLAPMRFRTSAVWRAYAVTMALCCTIATASFDELHQSFIPSRTGLVRDIWLDASGAAVMVACVSLAWLQRPVKPFSASAWE